MALTRVIDSTSSTTTNQYTVTGAAAVTRNIAYTCPAGKKAYVIFNYANSNTTNNLTMYMSDPFDVNFTESIAFNMAGTEISDWAFFTSNTAVQPWEDSADTESGFFRTGTNQFFRRKLPIFAGQSFEYSTSAANAFRFIYTIIEEDA